MNTADLPYLVARVTALEALVVALLAERDTSRSDLAAVAAKSLASSGYDDNEFLSDGMAFNDTAQNFVTELVTQGERLARR